MNCEALRKTLALEDVHQRPDLGAMNEHLKDCRSCREDFSEVAFMFGSETAAAAPDSSKQAMAPRSLLPSWGRRAAAMVCVVVCALVGLGYWSLGGPDAESKQNETPAGNTTEEEGANLPSVRAAAIPTYAEFSTIVTRYENGRVVTTIQSEAREHYGLETSGRISE